MYFCPDCSYCFDITKSSSTSKNENRQFINVNEIFQKIEAKEDLSLYKSDFQIKDMIKNKKYQKLSDNNKVLVNQLIDKNISSGAEFRCNNCNNVKEINETILLYNIVMDDANIKIKTFEENKFMCKDPLLPHTKDYICKNPSCISHKNESIKDSVFYRDKNSFKLNYICSVCYFGW
jgi:hypothetical protein